MSDVGRNDPCPCGSRKKYKHCHLAAQEAQGFAAAESHRIHERDHALVRRMVDFAYVHFESEFPGFEDVEQVELQFVVPMALYHVPFEGKSIAERFANAENASLDADERRWLDAQRDAWLSIWEVESVVPGRSITLRDRLTGERREVVERMASNEVVLRHHMLVRIVDFEGKSYICGMHPFPLRPLIAIDVIDDIRRRLRVKRSVSPKRLRGFPAARIITDAWVDAVDAVAESARKGPTFANTDGDPLVLVKDRYAIAADRQEIAAAIREMPGVNEEIDGALILLRGDTVVARIVLSANRLTSETNSLRRADSARQAIESVGNSKVRFESREVVDPLSTRVREAVSASPRVEPSPEMSSVVREMKRRHYASWLDEHIPALGGQTPREAVGNDRDRVDALLRDIEHGEAKVHPDERFDVAWLRQQLDLHG